MKVAAILKIMVSEFVKTQPKHKTGLDKVIKINPDQTHFAIFLSRLNMIDRLKGTVEITLSKTQ